MRQEAPYPIILKGLVDSLVHRPHWCFELEDIDRGQGSAGLTLAITITCEDSYDHDRLRSVVHYFPVPPAAYDERSWRRWLFEQCRLVSTHEDMEYFTLDGYKPYAPSHGPGNDPYIVRELGTELDQRTSYKGVVNT